MLAAIPVRANQNDTGLASFYSDVPDKSEMLSAAHRSLAFGTMVSVVRVDTGAHVVVRINDRGPFIRGRIIDLSCSAAEQLGMVDVGVAPVTVQVIPAPVPAIRKSRPPQ
jgi:rare lipoprotein A